MKEAEKKEFTTTSFNKISIVIPIRNEDQNIISCLKSLTNQNYNSADFEIIIVDDHSTENTRILVNKFQKESKLNIGIYQLENISGKKAALNFGIEKSAYNIIASTDADCQVPKAWLFNISQQFNNKSNMVLGPVIFHQRKGMGNAFQILDMIAIQGVSFGMLYYRKPCLNNAANLSYLKDDFISVKGFDSFNTPSGDDIFLLEKFVQDNKNVIGLLKEDFVVETKSEKSFSNFINQRLRWASKTKYYSNSWLIFISSIILLQNISLIFIYLGVVFVENYWLILTILLFCKWLIDFILLFLATSFFKRRKVLRYFIPVQVIYPIYILFVWVASLTRTYEWKGRKFNG